MHNLKVTWNAAVLDTGGLPAQIISYRIFNHDVQVAEVANVLEHTISNIDPTETFSISVSAVNSVGEGARSGEFIVSPQRSVPEQVDGVMALIITASGDVAPVINSTPNPSFIQGSASNYSMSAHVTDDGLSALTYSLSGSLASGLTLNSSTGVLSYDGVGANSSNSHTLTVTDAVGNDVSASFTVSIADGTALSFYQNLAPDQWHEIELNSVSDVDPCPTSNCSWSSGNNNSPIYTNWCGGAIVDTVGPLGSFIVGPGGGHGSYTGDEFYTFDLDTRTWTLRYQPSSGWSPYDGQGWNAQNKPASAHTYSSQGFHPKYGGPLGSYCVFIGAPSPAAGTTPITACYPFDRDDGTWDRLDSPSGIFATGASVAYDDERELFSMVEALSLASAPRKVIDVLASSGSQVTNAENTLHRLGSRTTIHQRLDVLVTLDPQVPELTIVSLSGAFSAQTVSMSSYPGSASEAGFEYCPPLDAIVMFSGNGQKNIHLLKPNANDNPLSAWVWSTRSISGLTPENPINNIHSRFRWSKKTNCFILSNSRSGPVYALRPNAPDSWTARSTAPGVLMSSRFDTAEEVTDHLADWQGNTFSDSDHVSWQQTGQASGNGCLRFDVLKTDTSASGQWWRYLSEDQRDFRTGDVVYIQYKAFFPAYYATHQFAVSSLSGWKVSIISSHQSSNRLYEIVHQNTRHRGHVQMYNRTTSGGFPPMDTAISTPQNPNDFVHQNAIDRSPGSVPSTALQARQKYGGLFSYNGPPDPDSETGAFIYYPDEWLTFLQRVEYGTFGTSTKDTHFQLWAARDADTHYTHLLDKMVDLGSVVDGSSNSWWPDALWMLPYDTNRIADPTRQDTYTLRDEIIVSTDWIPPK